MEHSFGRRAPYALGMEEELILVDADTLAISHCASEVVPRIETDAGSVMFDTYEALVEHASPVCRNAFDGAEALQALRDALRAAGGTFIGAGIHPDGAFGDVVHVPQQRYLEIAETMRGLLNRTPTSAIHVHVGMPDPETAIAACNRVRVFLPVLQALAANSPFWHGRDSGFATARANLFRGLPRAVIPREFGGWEDFATTVRAIVAAGELPDYTFLWWDVRPHPRLGTVEVRAMDGQSRIDSVRGLAALTHALCVLCAHEPPPGRMPPGEAIAESSFRASRDGLRATIWWDGALRPVPEVARDVLSLALPYARDARAEEALEEVERILAEGNGADRQRAAYAEGGMEAVLGLLAREAATAITRAPDSSGARSG